MKHDRSESVRYADEHTGAEITRLTGFRAHSNHLYFTNNPFYDGARKMVFESDRRNALNYYSIDLETGAIDQLTDLPQPPYPGEYPLHEGFVDSVKGNLFFFYANVLYRLSLNNCELTPIYRLPEGFFHHVISVSPDGEYVYTSITRSDVDRTAGDLPLRAIFEKNPESRILKIPVGGGAEEILFEENCFIAHVNISPADKDRLTFCHEGPWNLVDHRLWYMNLSDKKVQKIHPCQMGEAIGHEYWYRDGRRIGYHGALNGRFRLGCVDTDTGEDKTYDFPFHTGHIFSQDERLIVGDGGAEGRYLRLWRLTENGYEAPRALCAHNCSFRRQRAHVHPRMTPDGKGVVYTSDETGYEQVYLVRLPEDLASLPLLDSLAHAGAR